jgi:ribosomal RNA-processing protein 12
MEFADSAAHDPSASRRRIPGQEAARIKTDKSGKLIIEDSEDSDADIPAASANMALTSSSALDGASRNARGDLKFNRHTKQAREAERDEEMAADMAQDQGVSGGYRASAGRGGRGQGGLKKQGRGEGKKKAGGARLGDEFRAKVSCR